MKFDKIFLITIFIILLILMGSLLISVFLVRNRLDISQSEQSSYLPLSYGQVVSQKFTAKHDLLNIIMVNLKNPGLINRDEYQFLLKSEKGETLFEQTVNGFNIGDPGQIRFQFAPIIDSRNKTYVLQIIPLNSLSSGIVSLTVKEGSVKNFDNFMINDVSSGGVLNFSSYYRANDKINIFNTIIKELFNKVSKDIIFVFSWVLMIIFLILLYLKTSK